MKFKRKWSYIILRPQLQRKWYSTEETFRGNWYIYTISFMWLRNIGVNVFFKTRLTGYLSLLLVKHTTVIFTVLWEIGMKNRQDFFLNKNELDVLLSNHVYQLGICLKCFLSLSLEGLDFLFILHGQLGNLKLIIGFYK